LTSISNSFELIVLNHFSRTSSSSRSLKSLRLDSYT
jgi:hypothetical protein